MALLRTECEEWGDGGKTKGARPEDAEAEDAGGHIAESPHFPALRTQKGLARH